MPSWLYRTWQNQKIKYTLLSSMEFIHCRHMFCWNMISWENVTFFPKFSPIHYWDIIMYMFSLKCQIKFNQIFNLRNFLHLLVLFSFDVLAFMSSLLPSLVLSLDFYLCLMQLFQLLHHLYKFEFHIIFSFFSLVIDSQCFFYRL